MPIGGQEEQGHECGIGGSDGNYQEEDKSFDEDEDHEDRQLFPHEEVKAEYREENKSEDAEEIIHNDEENHSDDLKIQLSEEEEKEKEAPDEI